MYCTNTSAGEANESPRQSLFNSENLIGENILFQLCVWAIRE